MLEAAITTDLCSDIVASVLKKRGWTLSRIARAIEQSVEYVRRIQQRQQSFQTRDLERLAQACKVPPYRLIFDSLDREGLDDEMQALYDLTLQEVTRHEQLARVLARKPSKKRRSSTTKAA